MGCKLFSELFRAKTKILNLKVPIFDGPMAQLGESGTYAGKQFLIRLHPAPQIGNSKSQIFVKSPKRHFPNAYFARCAYFWLHDIYDFGGCILAWRKIPLVESNISELFVACLKNFGVLCIGLYRLIHRLKFLQIRPLRFRDNTASFNASSKRYVITNPPGNESFLK